MKIYHNIGEMWPVMVHMNQTDSKWRERKKSNRNSMCHRQYEVEGYQCIWNSTIEYSLDEYFFLRFNSGFSMRHPVPNLAFLSVFVYLANNESIFFSCVLNVSWSRDGLAYKTDARYLNFSKSKPKNSTIEMTTHCSRFSGRK